MTKAEILRQLQEFETSALDFFQKSMGLKPKSNFTQDYWTDAPVEIRLESDELARRLTKLAANYLNCVGHSPLATDADIAEIRLTFREIASSLEFAEFQYFPPREISEEDRIYGMRQAETNEQEVAPSQAASICKENLLVLSRQLKLMVPDEDQIPQAIIATEIPTIQRFRPNTAFIMMQINDDPHLADVKTIIREVFKEFGIKAVRSDEIEHADVITQRILDEIATSEFLIADLTGARPSVYYEIGYAHALKKRPILIRSKGTALHFDLLVHNVPEYDGIFDLRKKLRARLEALTGRSAP